MSYNTRFRMRDLFMHERLSKIFPQFSASELGNNAQSAVKAQKTVLAYIVATFNGTLTGGSTVTVKGQHARVLSQIQRLQAVLERLINNAQSIQRGIQNNTALYTRFQSFTELEQLGTVAKRVAALETVMDNIAYNPHFSNPSAKPSAAYLKKQEQWKKKVGYKE